MASSPGDSTMVGTRMRPICGISSRGQSVWRLVRRERLRVPTPPAEVTSGRRGLRWHQRPSPGSPLSTRSSPGVSPCFGDCRNTECRNGDLQEHRLQEERLQKRRLQKRRLPEERLPEERLPEERLPEERLPEGRLPEGRLPEERRRPEQRRTGRVSEPA